MFVNMRYSRSEIPGEKDARRAVWRGGVAMFHVKTGGVIHGVYPAMAGKMAFHHGASGWFGLYDGADENRSVPFGGLIGC